MLRLREGFDADLIPPSTPTYHEIGQNRFAASCSICGARIYVDETLIDRIHNALASGFESPAICEECEVEADLPARGQAA